MLLKPTGLIYLLILHNIFDENQFRRLLICFDWTISAQVIFCLLVVVNINQIILPAFLNWSLSQIILFRKLQSSRADKHRTKLKLPYLLTGELPHSRRDTIWWWGNQFKPINFRFVKGVRCNFLALWKIPSMWYTLLKIIALWYTLDTLKLVQRATSWPAQGQGNQEE